MEGSFPGTLGGYELIHKVATGGMASLYLARRAGARGFVRPVAIKLVHTHLADDPEFVQMFVDEANICSRLSHPNIVHVEELGEENGCLYLVMEFVDGCSLGALLNYTHTQQRRLPLSLAVHIIASAADGLHAAHEARGDDDQPLCLVHRDVSPTNLLLSRMGHVKVIDFGVAKSTATQHHTRAKMLKGKVRYMSPEQVSYQPIDRRSDIYSLGVVLWEVLANRPAFRAKGDIGLVHEVTTKPLLPIDSIRGDLPEALISALRMATQREPESRFATAHEFRDALVGAVPEALTVVETAVSEFVEEVLAAKGLEPSSQQRVRSNLDSEQTTVTPTPTPPPLAGARRHVVIAALAAIVAALSVALTVSLWPDPEVARASSSSVKLVPPVPESAAAIPSQIAPVDPNLVLRRDSLEGEESDRGPVKDVKPAENAQRRRKPTRAARSLRRAQPRKVTAAAGPTQTPIEEPRPVEVEGSLLAGPDALDYSMMKGAFYRSKAVRVEQDDVTLADEYQ